MRKPLIHTHCHLICCVYIKGRVPICVNAHCLMLEVLRYKALNALNTVQKIKAMSKMSKIDQIHLRAVMLCMSKTSKIDQIHLRTVMLCVTVLGHSPLSRPVAWQRSSSPIGLGYWRYASTHPLNALQMAALRAAIWTHLATERWPLLNFL